MYSEVFKRPAFQKFVKKLARILKKIFLTSIAVSFTLIGGMIGIRIAVETATKTKDIHAVSPSLIQIISTSQLVADFTILAYGVTGAILGFLIGFLPLLRSILRAKDRFPEQEQHIL